MNGPLMAKTQEAAGFLLSIRSISGNVNQLQVAWTFQTGELGTYEGTHAMEKAAFEATPLMIGNALYFSTPSDRVFAMDASNGKMLWLYDPKVDLHEDYSEITSRGVSIWRPSAGDRCSIKK